ncbi:hypothetical protein [uncultured Rikenella sp.]|uniref:hypothetical protein n=1 Tax=uncultured Rikenella sp. TaxID=368003 RepID=UPI0026392C64|nr:hypothetical protein [uncultured Rikenella sp.]
MPSGPAPGFRDAGNNKWFGGLGNVGGDGTVWSSAVSGTNGWRLLFYTGAMSPSATYNRAGGFQLRCLSE